MASSSAADVSITREQLTKYFHLPITDVAKELGICATMLKKICRKNGIPRWPHRKVLRGLCCCLVKIIFLPEYKKIIHLCGYFFFSYFVVVCCIVMQQCNIIFIISLYVVVHYAISFTCVWGNNNEGKDRLKVLGCTILTTIFILFRLRA